MYLWSDQVFKMGPHLAAGLRVVSMIKDTITARCVKCAKRSIRTHSLESAVVISIWCDIWGDRYNSHIRLFNYWFELWLYYIGETLQQRFMLNIDRSKRMCVYMEQSSVWFGSFRNFVSLNSPDKYLKQKSFLVTFSLGLHEMRERSWSWS